ncbi:MAG TPA: histidine kinase [Actinomycetota bacterium]|nr:histidine kinase [Actinomycetota bacterium]
MSRKRRPVPRRILLIGAAEIGLLALVLGLIVGRRNLTTDAADLPPAHVSFPLAMFLFVVVGLLILSRLPRHPIGRLMLVLGTVGVSLELFGDYAVLALLSGPGELPLGAESAWVYDWNWVLFMMLIPPLLLLFPDGRLLSRRWGWVLLADALFALCFLGAALFTWPQRGLGLLVPGEEPDLSPVQEALQAAGGAFLLLTLLLSAVSLVVRYRRADGVQRHQLKWLAASSLLLAISILLVYFVFQGEYTSLEVVVHLALMTLPVAVGVAVFKYRLYDIDVAINRALVYGSLVAFITAIYVAVVVGVGSLIGAGEEPNLWLQIIATALIAVAFQPFKHRVQRMANRLVYGRRSTPYEVLAEFSNKMAGAYAQDELPTEMAATLARGTGAASAHVWVKVGGYLRLAASFHEHAGSNHSAHDDEHAPIPIGEGTPEIPGSDHVVPVTHEGELLGALSITKRSGEVVTPVEAKLMDDLAAQAGVVMRNARLTEELLLRAEELAASRKRLVAAANQARRRLERDLHDGAQQQLVALKVKLSLAQRMATQDKVKGFLTQLQAEADDTLQTLRDLARGIYPALLADKGLEAALIAQANKSTLDVEIRAEGVGRYSQEVEAAVYFCCLEGLQNVAKYAGEAAVVIRLAADRDSLTFEVADNGRGFDPATAERGSGIQNMLDRMDALGGSLKVSSSPGGGTRVTGRVPARALQPA